jgi:hypothetical protein
MTTGYLVPFQQMPKTDTTLENFIFKHTIGLKKVHRNKKKKRKNLWDIKLAQTSCQNLSMSKINRL